MPPPVTRETIVPSMAETLPAEAAAAFPGLDLSLPDAGGVGAVFAPRRRKRTLGGGPALGSPAGPPTPSWPMKSLVAGKPAARCHPRSAARVLVGIATETTFALDGLDDHLRFYGHHDRNISALEA